MTQPLNFAISGRLSTPAGRLGPSDRPGGGGLWAAQQQGRALWLVPSIFMASMALGGVAGAPGGPAIGVEPMLALSVPAARL